MFLKLENINPGPGNYEEVSQLSDKGRYTVSRFQGNGQRLFDKNQRETLFDYRARKNKNPGPGSYRSPSDFGHYDGEVYGKTGGISYLAATSKVSRTSRVSTKNHV